jgi:hypothetical protein
LLHRVTRESPPCLSASRNPPLARACRPANCSQRPIEFGSAADGWDAYNDWLDRVRQPAPPSRQAVISKSLYSIASYKTWADKARGAFDKPK